MRGSGDISPEEKLLRLIKNKPGQQKEKSQIKGTAPSEGSALAAATPKNKDAFNLKAPREAIRLDFDLINNTLIILALFLLVYILTDFMFLSPSYRKRLKGIKKSVSSQGPDALETITPLSYSYYSAQLKGKSLFKALHRREQRAGALDKKELKELIKDLALIGIISEEQPQAIIEDRSTKKSYFLRKGEDINGVEVIEVKNNKVVLEYQGEKFDLYL